MWAALCLAPLVGGVSGLAGTDLSTLVRGRKTVIPGVGTGMLKRFHARARLQVQPDPRPYLIETVTLPPPDLELFFDVET